MDFRTYDSADFINPIVSDFRHLFPQKEYKVRADGKSDVTRNGLAKR